MRRFTVQGYRAVGIAPANLHAVCFVGVGISGHQLLYLQYALANPISMPKVPQNQLCVTLHPIAEQVVSQLAH